MMTKNRFLFIMLLNVSGVALLLSWWLPVNHGFWFPIDSDIFHFFNEGLIKSRVFLWLVAITNNRVFDAFSLFAMGLLMLRFWVHETPAGKRRIVIIGLVMLIAALVISQISKSLPISRSSPTRYFTNIYRVNDLLNFPTKDSSGDSFPGDHGLILIIFYSFMLRYFGKKAFGIALLIFIVFSSPRMMIGAHWFTDIYVGSLSLALICLPWFLLTSLTDKLADWLDQHLPGKNNQISSH